ncbi:hypothetical protein BC833DRAFT_594276 [Globomyces pollinis-pini]|nr:hypothetical protein BC833DRAFT_594276 [Globomyces pollinis-pini]
MDNVSKSPILSTIHLATEVPNYSSAEDHAYEQRNMKSKNQTKRRVSKRSGISRSMKLQKSLSSIEGEMVLPRTSISTPKRVSISSHQELNKSLNQSPFNYMVSDSPMKPSELNRSVTQNRKSSISSLNQSKNVSSESSSVSVADIEDIKESLKDHFDAIRSLQNVFVNNGYVEEIDLEDSIKNRLIKVENRLDGLLPPNGIENTQNHHFNMQLQIDKILSRLNKIERILRVKSDDPDQEDDRIPQALFNSPRNNSTTKSLNTQSNVNLKTRSKQTINEPSRNSTEEEKANVDEIKSLKSSINQAKDRRVSDGLKADIIRQETAYENSKRRSVIDVKGTVNEQQTDTPLTDPKKATIGIDNIKMVDDMPKGIASSGKYDASFIEHGSSPLPQQKSAIHKPNPIDDSQYRSVSANLDIKGNNDLQDSSSVAGNAKPTHTKSSQFIIQTSKAESPSKLGLNTDNSVKFGLKEGSNQEKIDAASQKIDGLTRDDSQVFENSELNEKSNHLQLLTSQFHKFQHDYKIQIRVNETLMEQNDQLEEKVLKLSHQIKKLRNGNAQKSNDSADIKETLNNTGSTNTVIQSLLNSSNQTDQDVKKLSDKLLGIKQIVKGKVDTAVLEELIRHIATRDELSNYLKKSSLQKIVSKYKLKGNDQEKLQEVMMNRLSEFKNEIESKAIRIKNEILNEINHSDNQKLFASSLVDQNILELKNWTQKLVKRTIDESEMSNNSQLNIVRNDLILQCKDLVQTQIQKFSNEFQPHIKNSKNNSSRDGKQDSLQDQPMTNDLMVQKLTLDFDEKLFILCSELTACKTLFERQARQPFYRCGQWLWNSGTLKLGSAVPWNLETTNTDPENFKWDADNHNIRIKDAGLYEINLAFFTKAKPSIQLVVNGESVLSAINSPSYIVHHSSGFVTDGTGRVESGTVTGISLVDFLTIPSKSTVSIHFHGLKKNIPAHGFLGLKRL